MEKIYLTLLLLGLLSVPSYSGAEISAPAWAVPMNDNNLETLWMQWAAVPGATGYEVWAINSSEYECGAPTEECEPMDFIVESLEHSSYTYWYGVNSSEIDEVVNYEFRIKAFDDVSTSDFSEPIYGSVRPDIPPIDPCEIWENCDPSFGLGGGCFIATAAYGSYWESHVMTLRQFRDSHLLTNKLGTRFVQAYYKYSPPMADYIAEHDSLRSVTRIGLAPLVGFSLLAINFGIVTALTILFSLLTMIIGGTYSIVRTKESK
jgi:hypothetical protein